MTVGSKVSKVDLVCCAVVPGGKFVPTSAFGTDALPYLISSCKGALEPCDKSDVSSFVHTDHCGCSADCHTLNSAVILPETIKEPVVKTSEAALLECTKVVSDDLVARDLHVDDD